MLFGLSNAPASFQGYINKILAKKFNVFVIVYLDDIFIYSKDEGQGHVEAVQWMLDFLQKNRLFANLKKYRFYQDKVRFLGYILSAKRVQMEDEKIEVVKNWLEPKSVKDIQIFLGFANFYQCFIQGFNKIAGLLTLMLKITKLAKNLSLSIAKDVEVGSIGGNGDCEDETVKKSPSKNSNGVMGYLTPKARLAFTKLRKRFTKAQILRIFDPEY